MDPIQKMASRFNYLRVEEFIVVIGVIYVRLVDIGVLFCDKIG